MCRNLETQVPNFNPLPIVPAPNFESSIRRHKDKFASLEQLEVLDLTGSFFGLLLLSSFYLQLATAVRLDIKAPRLHPKPQLDCSLVVEAPR